MSEQPAFDELSIQACVERGPLVHGLTALRECLGCTKTYPIESLTSG